MCTTTTTTLRHNDSSVNSSFMSYIDCMATDKPILNFPIDEALLKRVDDFRFKGRFASRADAVRWLLSYALDQKPKVEQE